MATKHLIDTERPQSLRTSAFEVKKKFHSKEHVNKL